MTSWRNNQISADWLLETAQSIQLNHMN